ncbi:tyrosine-type recombinase/integrase [Prochlorococcus sp. MIT 1201]|uniref:tyrosine-type recombinase/integrase n=1 Tax=Prochlorococcus sp. MIT 1201 TaxID=3082535 RepID=UPI0039A4D9A3
MPRIHVKEKVLGGKGVVFSYITDTEKFYYREMVKGTNTYRYKLIKNANTIESAVENFIDAYTELREEIKAIEAGVSFIKNTKDRDNESDISKLNNYIKKQRQKSREISNCVDDYLSRIRKKVDSGLIVEKTYNDKRLILRNQLIPYLDSIKITKTIQIDNNTFNDYPFWRDAAKSTRRLELIHIKDFIVNYCDRNNLIASGVDLKSITPLIKINESELDANPPLIENENWNSILNGLKVLKDNSKSNIRTDYFSKMFYRWCLIAKNSGLRPNRELNQLRWCDVKRENVGRWSKTDQVMKDKWVAVIYIKNTKTGKQRTVPTNGVDSQLTQWRKEQKKHIDKHYPGIEITDETLIFGNPGNGMKQFSYNNYNRYWYKLMEILKGKLKPYVFSDRPYTIYSLRSTYICNLILQGKDIYTTAKLAGHTVSVCERYYAKLDMGSKAKQVTDFQYGVQGRRKTDTGSYIEDDIEQGITKHTQSNWSKDDSNSYQRSSSKNRSTTNRGQTVTAEEQ